MATVTTDATGYYSVAGLSDMVYTVRVTDTGSASPATRRPTRGPKERRPVQLPGVGRPRRRRRHERQLRLREAAADLRGGRPADGLTWPTGRSRSSGARRSRWGRWASTSCGSTPRRGSTCSSPSGSSPASSCTRREASIASATPGRPRRDGSPTRSWSRTSAAARARTGRTPSPCPPSGLPGPRCRSHRGPAAAGVQPPGRRPRPVRQALRAAVAGRAAAGVGAEVAATGPGVQGDDAREWDPLPPRGRHRPVLRRARGADREPDPWRSVTLSHRGSVVPYLPDGSGTGFYFYAEPVGSPYTDENAYWVTVAPGPTVSARPAVPAGLLATSFTETLHQELDQYPLLTTPTTRRGTSGSGTTSTRATTGWTRGASRSARVASPGPATRR